MLAHRGTSILAPENTEPAFDFGVRHGADVLEIDVRLNREGELMVTHDETVDRTTNGSGKVADFGLPRHLSNLMLHIDLMLLGRVLQNNREAL